MPKPKTSKTKSAIPAPVEDQAKLTKPKKKGRPAKTKPVTEEPTQEEFSGDLETADAMDIDEVEEPAADSEGDEEPAVTSSTENEQNSKPAAAPGARTKQRRAGLTLPIMKMRENLRKGTITALSS